MLLLQALCVRIQHILCQTFTCSRTELKVHQQFVLVATCVFLSKVTVVKSSEQGIKHYTY